MATMERVAELFHARINHDSPSQLEKAGNIWMGLPLDFFYLSHAEDTVDIVVTSIAQRVAEEDGNNIPGSVLENLQRLVNPTTVVSAAIRLVFLTAFDPESNA